MTNKQLARIRYKNDKIKEKFIKFNRLRRKRSDDYKRTLVSNAIKDIGSVQERELKLIGIALYWAQGYKGSNWKTVSFTNSDPKMIKLIMNWFRVICKVPDNKFRIRIQCHSTSKIKLAEEYWSKITVIPVAQFTKAYVKISSSSKKKMGNLCLYGICEIGFQI